MSMEGELIKLLEDFEMIQKFHNSSSNSKVAFEISLKEN
jgi:hypothetical protein